MTIWGNFRTPSIYRQQLKVESRNFTFGTQIDHGGGTIVKMQNWVKGGQMTAFGNFGTISIYRQRLKLETSNLARRLITRGTIVKDAKSVKGRFQGLT